MAKVTLYLDTRAARKDDAPLKIRVCKGEIAKFVHTGIRIPPSLWDPETSSVRAGDESTMALAQAVVDLKDIISTMPLPPARQALPAKERVELISKAVAEALGDRKPKNRKKPERDAIFIHMMEKLRDSKAKEGTREVYDRTVRALRRYDPDIDCRTYGDIDYAWLRDFEAHCVAQGMKVNSISILMRNIRATFNEAIRRDLTDKYPFRKYSIRQESTAKRSMALEDLRRLASMQVETWHEEYRDLFFLSFMLVGINMADLLSLKPEDMHDGRIEYRRLKTGTEYSIKVEPEARAIIEKYRGSRYLLAPLERYRSAKDYIQHMDRALKQMGRKTGKQGKILSGGTFPYLTSYWARHSWATLAYELNVPIDIIAQGLGHKDRNHRVTVVYIRQNCRKVDEANRQVIDALLGIQRQEPAPTPAPAPEKVLSEVNKFTQCPYDAMNGGFVTSGTYGYTTSW